MISAAVRCALNSPKFLQSEEGLRSQIAAAKAEGAKEYMEKLFALGFHADFEKFRNEKLEKPRDKENAK